MTKHLLALAAVCLIIAAQGQSQRADPPTTRPTAAPPMEFDKYHFVVLTAAENPPQLSPEQARQLQGEHLGHLTKMGEAGHILVAGPFGDRFDDKWRGLCLYNGALSRDEVRALAEADPAVQAGTMTVQIMDWYTSKGALAFPMTRDKPPAAGAQ